MYNIPYMWNVKRNDTDELIKQKETHRLKRTNLWLPGRGMDMYTLLYLKWITNKDLLSSTGNSAQCDVAAWMEGSLGEMDSYVCLAESLHCSPKTITLFISYAPIQNKKFSNTAIFKMDNQQRSIL